MQSGATFSCLHIKIDIGKELNVNWNCKTDSENGIVMKTVESTEIVGHVPEFIAQVLVPMVRSGEIASIDAVRTDKLRNAHRRYMDAYQICGCKNKREEEKD